MLEYFPDLYDYGIQEFDSFHAKTQEDILRELRIRWWPTQQNRIRHDISVIVPVEMDYEWLTLSQFTRTAVFHCLAYYILPQLSKFEPDGDRFAEMMKYYRERYQEEFELVLRDGVEYDFDQDSSISVEERQPQNFLKLQR